MLPARRSVAGAALSLASGPFTMGGPASTWVSGARHGQGSDGRGPRYRGPWARQSISNGAAGYSETGIGGIHGEDESRETVSTLVRPVLLVPLGRGDQ